MTPDSIQTTNSEEFAPRIAVKDGFAIERISGVEVRRQVIAGQPVPAHYEVDEDLLGDKKANTILGQRTYKSEQIEERVSYDNADGIHGYEPERVERVDGVDADSPQAEGEKELAEEHTPLAARSKKGESVSSAERAKKADEEQEKSRASEREGTPAERLEKRLAGKPKDEGKGADKAPTARGRKAEGDKPETTASTEAPKGDS